MTYHTTVCRSIEDVEAADWKRLQRSPADVFMDPRFIRVMERSTAAENEFAHLLVRDNAGRPVAAACCYAAWVDLAEAAEGRLRTVLSFLRRFIPRLTRARMACCGLPVPVGQNHLRIAPEADAREVLRAIDGALHEFAVQQKARLLAFREFTSEERPRLDSLIELGYILGECAPMNHAPTGFRDFDDYCAKLGARKRYPIRKSRKKFQESGLVVEHRRGCQGMATLYDDQVHRLFENVVEGKSALDKLPADFFRELATQLPEESVFTLVRQAERIVAFAASLDAGGTFQQMFVGYEPELNPANDLYFNTFFEAVDYAWRHDSQEVLIGGSCDTFKSQKLSAVRRPRYFYLKCLRPLGAVIARWAVQSLQPLRNWSKSETA